MQYLTDTDKDGRIAELETTIRTFLHDLDGHDDDNWPVRMSVGMWLQVQAFKKLVKVW